MRNRRLRLSRRQEEDLAMNFKDPAHDKKWSEVRAGLFGIMETFDGTPGQRLHQLIQMFSIDGLHAVRSVRGKLHIIISCSCGRCGEKFSRPLRRKKDKILRDTFDLCRAQSSGSAGSMATIGQANRVFNG